MFLGYTWPTFHAAVNDLPAALLIFAVIFEFAGWLLKRESLRWAAIWTLWAGVLGGWIAVFAGEQAEELIDHGEAIHELMELHEKLALITMAIFTLVLIWQMWRRFNAPAAETAILRVLMIAGAAVLVGVGKVGGKMYFEHAAGVPTQTMKDEIQNRAEGHHHHPGEADDDDHDHDHAAPQAADSGHTH